MDKVQFEFTASPFQTDVAFRDWFRKERKVRGHQSAAETAREIGLPPGTVQNWVANDKYPRTHLPIVKLAEWSGEPIRLIRGMIEHQKATDGQTAITVPARDYAQPWRAVPQSRQQSIDRWLQLQIDFFDGQGGSMREFAATLRAAKEELRKSAEASRRALKEVEIVRPSTQVVES